MYMAAAAKARARSAALGDKACFVCGFGGGCGVGGRGPGSLVASAIVGNFMIFIPISSSGKSG